MEVLERQVSSLTPNPYTLEREGRYLSRADVERGELLLLEPGRLQLVRSYHEPPPRVLAYDARLLAAMTLLGPLSWDLIDEECVEPLGGGDDVGSLVRHLSLEHDETALRAEYARRFTPFVFDASQAGDVDELFRMLSLALGASSPLAGEASSRHAFVIGWRHRGAGSGDSSRAPQRLPDEDLPACSQADLPRFSRTCRCLLILHACSVMNPA